LRYRDKKREKTEQKREQPSPLAFLISATRNALSHYRHSSTTSRNRRETETKQKRRKNRRGQK
jgi:hypothetical protein